MHASCTCTNLAPGCKLAISLLRTSPLTPIWGPTIMALMVPHLSLIPLTLAPITTTTPSVSRVAMAIGIQQTRPGKVPATSDIWMRQLQNTKRTASSRYEMASYASSLPSPYNDTQCYSYDMVTDTGAALGGRWLSSVRCTPNTRAHSPVPRKLSGNRF